MQTKFKDIAQYYLGTTDTMLGKVFPKQSILK